MRTLIFVLALIVIAFATNEALSRPGSVLLLPKRIKSVNTQYEGTLTLDTDRIKKTIPVSGEFHFRHTADKTNIFDKCNLELEDGRSITVLHWVNFQQGNKALFTKVNDKCLKLVLSEEKHTLPEFSGWTKNGDNFEQTSRLTAKLSDIFPGVEGLEDDAEKEIEGKSEITMKDGKISNFRCSLMIDGKLVAVKDVHPTEEISRPRLAKLFLVPHICNAPSRGLRDVAFEDLYIGMGVRKMLMRKVVRHKIEQRSSDENSEENPSENQ